MHATARPGLDQRRPPPAHRWRDGADVDRPQRTPGFPLRGRDRVVHELAGVHFVDARFIRDHERDPDESHRPLARASKHPEPRSGRTVRDAHAGRGIDVAVLGCVRAGGQNHPSRPVHDPALLDRAGHQDRLAARDEQRIARSERARHQVAGKPTFPISSRAAQNGRVDSRSRRRPDESPLERPQLFKRHAGVRLHKTAMRASLPVSSLWAVPSRPHESSPSPGSRRASRSFCSSANASGPPHALHASRKNVDARMSA